MTYFIFIISLVFLSVTSHASDRMSASAIREATGGKCLHSGVTKPSANDQSDAYGNLWGTGEGSVYGYKGDKMQGGTKTASGEQINPNDLTASHRAAPLNSNIIIMNMEPGMEDRRIVVRVNERGPYCNGRIVDMTPATARAIGCPEKGVCNVAVYRAIGAQVQAPYATPLAVNRH